MSIVPLEALLRDLGRVAVAYSGGVDSALLLDVAHATLGPDAALGLIARSETLTDAEHDEAVALADARGWRLATITYSELAIPNYAANPTNRCFFCKNEMWERLLPIARARGFEVLCDGTNASDLGDHRPGMAAGRAHGIRSPLLEAGLTKDAIRAEARRRGLANWDKPSGACLSSRFPYGTTITRDALERVGAAEALLRGLGFRVLRVRHHDTIARVELGPDELARAVEPALRAAMSAGLRALGYAYVALDLDGYRTGSLNESLGAAGPAGHPPAGT